MLFCVGQSLSFQKVWKAKHNFLNLDHFWWPAGGDTCGCKKDYSCVEANEETWLPWSMTLANTFLMGLCNEFMVWVSSLNSYWIQPAHSHHWCHCCGSLTFSVSFGIGAMTHQDIALVRSGCYSQPVIFHRAGNCFCILTETIIFSKWTVWLTSRCMSVHFPSFSQSDPPLFCHIRVQNQGLKTHNSVRLCPAVVLFPSGAFSCKLALPAAWWWHDDDILQLFVLCLCFSGGKQQVWLWIVDGRYIRF